MDEVTAEYEVAELAPVTPLRLRLSVTVGAKTDMGRVRENNEDKFEYFVPSSDDALARSGMVFLVCDGMGGHEAGQIASELATKTFLETYLHHSVGDPESRLRSAVGSANRFVIDVARTIPSRRGMGTTLSALVLLQDQGYVAQVGDSRVYRLRRGVCELITVDHTWVEQMVLHGAMSRVDAESHPNRHMLLKAIGTENEADPDIYAFRIEPDDVYLLCSDGVTNHVSDERIGELMAEDGPSETAWKVVNAALVGGGSDNATVLIVRVDAMAPVE